MICLSCYQDGLSNAEGCCCFCGSSFPELLKDVAPEIAQISRSLAHKKNEPTATQTVATLTRTIQRDPALLRTTLRTQGFAHHRNELGMDFILIQPGSFMMGSPPRECGRDTDETLHRVEISRPYFLQNTPVTQQQWQQVMGTNPSWFKHPDHPVECVSWEDVQDFITALNRRRLGTYRLPTEAEWEYACRAGGNSPFSVGNGEDLDAEQANFDGDYPYGRGLRKASPGATTPVKSYRPNRWGLYDMHGNVWEWCQDWYGPYPDTTVSDPVGPEVGSARVARGGSWDYFASYCRSAYRVKHPASLRNYLFGFRMVLQVLG